MALTEIKDDFQYYMHDGTTAFSFEIAGNITNSAARELKQAWITASSTADGNLFVVDLSYVTQVDEAGRQLLREWYEAGAQFVAKRPQARDIVASITGRPFQVGSQAPKHHTWRPLDAFLR